MANSTIADSKGLYIGKGLSYQSSENIQKFSKRMHVKGPEGHNKMNQGNGTKYKLIQIGRN